jgi:excisionase family DNA binding protein
MNYNKGMENQPRPYTASSLARAAGVSVVYIARLCRQGKLRAMKLKSVWLIPREAGDAWLEARKREP